MEKFQNNNDNECNRQQSSMSPFYSSGISYTLVASATSDLIVFTPLWTPLLLSICYWQPDMRERDNQAYVLRSTTEEKEPSLLS